MKYQRPILLLSLCLILLATACRASPGEVDPAMETGSAAIQQDPPEEEQQTPLVPTEPLSGSPTADVLPPTQVLPSPVTITPPATFTPGPIAAAAPVFGIELVGSGITDKVASAAEAGSAWVRRNGLFWSEVEPAEGDRNWTALAQLEAEMVSVSEAGMELIVLVRSTPAWAQAVAGVFCGPVRADKLEAFGRFMHDVVLRYSQPPFNVKYWELGNEPDIDPKLVPPNQIFGCWGDRKAEYYGGEYYAEMLRVVYPQIKAADPQAEVLVGGLLLDCDPLNPPVSNGREKDCSPALFLEGILRNGGGAYFDGVSFHAYDFYYDTVGYYGNANWSSGWQQNGLIPVTVPKSRYLKRLLTEFGHGDKFLINSETALLCGRDQNEPPCRSDQFQAVKSYYVAQSNAVALAEGLRANIWYHLVRGWRASGLAADLSNRYPAYLAYQFSAEQLTGALFWGPAAEFDGVHGYKFVRDRGQGREEFWILWSLDGDSHPIALQTAPDQIFDVYGQLLERTTSLEITMAPVYLVWEPEP